MVTVECQMGRSGRLLETSATCVDIRSFIDATYFPREIGIIRKNRQSLLVV